MARSLCHGTKMVLKYEAGQRGCLYSGRAVLTLELAHWLRRPGCLLARCSTVSANTKEAGIVVKRSQETALFAQGDDGLVVVILISACSVLCCLETATAPFFRLSFISNSFCPGDNHSFLSTGFDCPYRTTLPPIQNKASVIQNYFRVTLSF
jgi:hypothetical protein